MNNTTQTDIKNDLEKIRACLRSIEQAEADLAQCNTDLGDLDRKIEKLSKPRYSDLKAIRELSVLKESRTLCLSTIDTIREAIARGYTELDLAIRDCGLDAAKLVLRPVVENCLATITAAVRPFCDTEKRADELAKQTDAYRFANDVMTTVANPPIATLPDYQVIAAKRIITIFEEALKSGGDILQFLTPAKKA